ncbi:WD repeat-containing protein 27 [Allomyces javanicus]|nr:WD repeat-containing protein 27 [Allomyces javanicus]
MVLSGDRTGRVVEHVLSFDRTSAGIVTPSVAPAGLVARFPGPCTHIALGPNRFAACVGVVVYVMVAPGPTTTGSKQSSVSVAHRPVSKSTSSRSPSAAATRSVWSTASRICLEGHHAPVICSQFGRSGEWLVTLAEDKTFKVWDLVQARCCYQSEILCPLAHLTHLAIDPVAHHLYVGSDDGILRVYAYKAVRGSGTTGSRSGTIGARTTAMRTSSKESRAIRFEPRLHAIINLAQPAAGPDDDSASKPVDIVISARGSTISPGDLGLGAKSDSATSLTDPVVDPIIATARVDHLLYIVTTTRLVVVDSNTLNRVAHVDLVQTDPDEQSDAVRAPAVGRVDRVTFLNPDDDEDHQHLTAVVSCPFDGSLKLLSLDSQHASGSDNTDDDANPRIQLAIDRIGSSKLHPDLLVSIILPAVLQALRGGHQPADSMWSKHALATVSASFVAAGVATLADVARLGKDAWARMALPLGIPAILAGLATRATAPPDARNHVEQFGWSSVPVAHLPAGSPMRKFLWSTKAPAMDPRDKPVTFRKTVTSSGYTSAPFVPKHLAKKPAAGATARPKSGMTRSTSVTSVRSASSAGGGDMPNEWMDEWLGDADDGDGDTNTVVVPRVAPRMVNETHVHPSAVTAVAVSTRGSKMVVGTSDRAICLVSTRTMASTATSFRMPQPVQTVAWNHDDSLVVASTRQAVAVWDARPSTEKSALLVMIEEPYAPDSVVGAQFFYQSRFLVVGHRNAVELVKFRSGSADGGSSGDAGRKSIRSSNASLNKGSVTGVQPRRQAGESKVVTTVPLEGAQYLTCLAADTLAANPWVLVGASDKSVALLDMATGRVAARVNPSAETGELPPIASVTAGGPRAPYALRVPTGATTPLFVTTAVNDLVKGCGASKQLATQSTAQATANSASSSPAKNKVKCKCKGKCKCKDGKQEPVTDVKAAAGDKTASTPTSPAKATPKPTPAAKPDLCPTAGGDAGADAKKAVPTVPSPTHAQGPGLSDSNGHAGVASSSAHDGTGSKLQLAADLSDHALRANSSIVAIQPGSTLNMAMSASSTAGMRPPTTATSVSLSSNAVGASASAAPVAPNVSGSCDVMETEAGPFKVPKTATSGTAAPAVGMPAGARADALTRSQYLAFSTRMVEETAVAPAAKPTSTPVAKSNKGQPTAHDADTDPRLMTASGRDLAIVYDPAANAHRTPDPVTENTKSLAEQPPATAEHDAYTKTPSGRNLADVYTAHMEEDDDRSEHPRVGSQAQLYAAASDAAAARASRQSVHENAAISTALPESVYELHTGPDEKTASHTSLDAAAAAPLPASTHDLAVRDHAKTASRMSLQMAAMAATLPASVMEIDEASSENRGDAASPREQEQASADDSREYLPLKGLSDENVAQNALNAPLPASIMDLTASDRAASHASLAHAKGIPLPASTMDLAVHESPRETASGSDHSLSTALATNLPASTNNLAESPHASHAQLTAAMTRAPLPASMHNLATASRTSSRTSVRDVQRSTSRPVSAGKPITTSNRATSRSSTHMAGVPLPASTNDLRTASRTSVHARNAPLPASMNDLASGSRASSRASVHVDRAIRAPLPGSTYELAAADTAGPRAASRSSVRSGSDDETRAVHAALPVSTDMLADDDDESRGPTEAQRAASEATLASPSGSRHSLHLAKAVQAPLPASTWELGTADEPAARASRDQLHQATAAPLPASTMDLAASDEPLASNESVHQSLDLDDAARAAPLPSSTYDLNVTNASRAASRANLHLDKATKVPLPGSTYDMTALGDGSRAASRTSVHLNHATRAPLPASTYDLAPESPSGTGSHPSVHLDTAARAPLPASTYDLAESTPRSASRTSMHMSDAVRAPLPASTYDLAPLAKSGSPSRTVSHTSIHHATRAPLPASTYDLAPAETTTTTEGSTAHLKTTALESPLPPSTNDLVRPTSASSDTAARAPLPASTNDLADRSATKVPLPASIMDLAPSRTSRPGSASGMRTSRPALGSAPARPSGGSASSTRRASVGGLVREGSRRASAAAAVGIGSPLRPASSESRKGVVQAVAVAGRAAVRPASGKGAGSSAATSRPGSGA